MFSFSSFSTHPNKRFPLFNTLLFTLCIINYTFFFIFNAVIENPNFRVAQYKSLRKKNTAKKCQPLRMHRTTLRSRGGGIHGMRKSKSSYLKTRPRFNSDLIYGKRIFDA